MPHWETYNPSDKEKPLLHQAVDIITKSVKGADPYIRFAGDTKEEQLANAQKIIDAVEKNEEGE